MRSILGVCLAASLAFAQRGGGAAAPQALEQASIDAALERGAAFLRASYTERLAKGRVGAQERNGQMALSLYTLLKSGVPRNDPTVERLLHALSKETPTQTYDTACFALALYTHDAIDNRPWLEELAAQLVEWQEKEGDWSYPGGIVDLSNTQYAALGLWAASRAGVRIESDVWRRMAQSVLRYSTADGGFGYTASAKSGTGSGATGSMTAAGVGTLAIAEGRLRLARELDATLEARIAAARGRGIEWLAKHFTVDTNPGSGGWHFYYLYGLERMGAVMGAPLLGPHDWYEQGAHWLLARQDVKGAWNNGTDLSETCFALLFLRRATSSEPRQRAPRSGERATQEGAAAPITIAAEASADARGALRLSIVDWDPALLRPFERAGERGRGPRVARVEWLVDGEAVAVELGLPSQPADRALFAVTPLFRAAGKRSVQAHVVALAEDGSEQRLASQLLEVEVVRALPAWMSQSSLDPLANRGPEAKPKARASSHAKGAATPFGEAYEAENAVDGNARTAWLAADGDPKRELSIQYSRAQVCATLVVRPAVLAALGADALSRPTKLEVVINGKAKHTLEFGADVLQPAVLKLSPPLSIKRLDLTLSAVAPGAAGGASSALVGLGEVELHGE
jgi:hypothetical protein